MKAEDVARLHDASGRLRWKDLRPETRADLIRFARACEQHGMRRAMKELRTLRARVAELESENARLLDEILRAWDSGRAQELADFNDHVAPSNKPR